MRLVTPSDLAILESDQPSCIPTTADMTETSTSIKMTLMEFASSTVSYYTSIHLPYNEEYYWIIR